MNNSAASSLLKGKLVLDIEPIAMACQDAAPVNVPVYSGSKPSACSFWREAEGNLFFAPAASHFNCPIGAMVLGFDLPPAVSIELMALVDKITKCGYIAVGEPGAIPTHPRKGAKGVLYGPLAKFPTTPDAVLLWLLPAQAMVVSEAVGGAIWGSNATVLGRPACAAIPQAVNSSQATLSLGCAGMRTYTAIAPDRLLTVVPGHSIAQFTSDVVRLSTINEDMASFYKERAAALST